MTRHQVLFTRSQDLSPIPDGAVDLVVTSPPYPMVEMWDGILALQNPAIEKALTQGHTDQVFELMHQELDQVWRECFRVLREGGIACINIGDAARTLHQTFRLFPNHARVLQACQKIGFCNLPNIIWRKPTNSPTKFMGSGMYAPGAYVTLEHEFILIFRKGGKREFITEAEKVLRRQSAFFWEERNIWFSDLWELKGAGQKLVGTETRLRSAAFPLELPYRLLHMFSVLGDTVLDPFLGTGTTTLAAIAAGRNSIGVEVDQALQPAIRKTMLQSGPLLHRLLHERLLRHRQFIQKTLQEKGAKALRYTNARYGFLVKTRQETEARFAFVAEVQQTGPAYFTATYEEKVLATYFTEILDLPLQPIL